MGLTYKRHIIKNKPYEDANGQYNYGRVENEPRHLLGIPPDINYGSDAIELYTTVEHKNVDWSRYPDGIAWNYFGSEIKITELGIQGRDRETDDNRYYNHQVALYLYDSDRTGIMPTTGNEIRTLIGGDNSFPNGPHVVNQKDFGTYNFPTECDPNGWGGDECRRQFVGVNTEDVSYEFPQEKMIIYDWPMEGHSKTNSMFTTAAVFNTDIEYWSKAITGKIANSYLYFVVRMSGDEKEYAPVGHGWLKLSGGYKNDELQRRYNVFRLNKADLYDVFVRGEEKIFGYGGSSSTYDKLITHLGPYDDNHGGGGHWGLPNAQGAAYYCSDIRITMKPPIWSPAKALTKNYRWVKKDTFGQLHPNYELDYTGFPQVFYQNPNKFWDSSFIKDFRPMSKVKSIIDTEDSITDLQNYYEKGTPYAVNSSAPMTVNLQFDLVRNVNSFNPKTFPEGEEVENNNYGIKYAWFVVNWDWNEDWEGGTTLEDIAEKDFPQTSAGILTKNLTENTYKLKMQGDTDVDESEIEFEFDVLKNEAVHTYIEPGIKVIKVVFLTYIESNHAGQDLEGNDYAGNYIQALQWKMATVKMNLSTDRAYANDFSDIGGSDYTYLPYPEVQLYDYPVEIQFEEDTARQLWCEDGINTPENVVPSPHINCETETTAHPVISGLSTESTYVQSLKGLLQTDHWGASEGGDRIMAEKSYENTPLQSVDEMGDFLGQSDLSTFRYFERPFNMHEFLDLNMVYAEADPSNNIYCKEVKTYSGPNGSNLVEDPYEPWPDGNHWCGQRWASRFHMGEYQGGTFLSDITSETGVGNANFDTQNFEVAKAICADGSEVILGFGQQGSGAYRMMFGSGVPGDDWLATYITDRDDWAGLTYEGINVEGPYEGGVWYGNVANGEWACAQQMGYPYDEVSTDPDHSIFDSIIMTYGQGQSGLQVVDIGEYFHPYTDTEYWDGENNKFMTESSATDIFISEYPILHDKCLVELNYDSYDAVTIRDTSGNGCKAVAFGDYSIKKDKRNQPTQRDSSIDTPKIGSSNDEKAY
tara:strand:- start:241 stop:3351 length:3111 start_codon:yes stop_codon:yes gene_type:complete